MLCSHDQEENSSSNPADGRPGTRVGEQVVFLEHKGNLSFSEWGPELQRASLTPLPHLKEWSEGECER